MKTIRELLEYGAGRLAATSSSARLDAELLLGFVLKASRIDLVSRSEFVVDESELNRFEALLKRRIIHEPISYITGIREFYGLDFQVSPAVLVPRPETEHLVEKALECAKELDGELRLIDLGTGSGCIAIAIASELQKRKRKHYILAVDKSKDALEIAEENAEFNRVNTVEFLESIWFESVPEQKFDLIISNPPYIADSDKQVSEATKFEPQAALFAGSDGLEAYRAILSQVKEFLTPKGRILFEIGFSQTEQLKKLSEEYFGAGNFEFEVKKDLAGLDRVVVISLINPGSHS